MPLVSVVIPTFNRARDLERAIASVLQQTVRDLEVIVVDKESTDDTDAVVAQFEDPRLQMVKTRNAGIVGKSRNVGIARAGAEFVAFLDSDDWWKPRKLEYSLQPLLAGADMTLHDLHLVTRAQQRVFWRTVRSKPVVAPVIRDLLANGNALPTSSVVVRRSLLVAVGGMTEDPAMVAMEDYDCWLRLARVTDRFVRLPQTLGFYWAGGGNLSNDTRTLALLNLLEDRYEQDLSTVNLRATPWWLTYARARAHYRTGAFVAARQQLDELR